MNTRVTDIFVASAVAALMAGAAAAQTATFDGVDAADDRIENLEESIQDDFDRDIEDSFGNTGRDLGFFGSVAARATATSGNTENFDLGIGVRLGFFDGKNGHDVNLSYSYGEEAGVASQNSLLASYDYTRTFSNDVFVFGKARTAYDEFGPFESDTFLGVGAGYRIINSDDTRLSVQTGPGYRWAADQAGMKIEEEAVAVGVDFFQRLTPSVFITNDLEVLYSESDTFVTNELGLNVAMTEALALRTSVITEYHTDPAPGFENTDNTVGASMVYSFN